MFEQKTIIGLTGQLASGKSTVANYLKEKYGATIYGFSGPLRDILKRLYLPMERPNLAALSETIRSTFGQDLISRTIIKDIELDENKLIILDGIRRMPDIEEAKKIPGFKLISVNTERELRYERLLKRGQNSDDATKTFDDFVKDEQKEADRGIPEIMAVADFEISNNENLEELYKKIEIMISKF